MKAIYSIAAKLGGGGIGTTSGNAVKGLYHHHLDPLVFCCSYDSFKVPPSERSDLRETHAAIFERIPFIPQKYQWFLKDYFHDLIVSWRLTACDVFHGWNGHCLRSLSVAKKKGAVTIVERASSHPNTYERLLREEYKRWDIEQEPILPMVKKRLLQELTLADYITTPSDFAYRSMIENGIPEEKLVKIPFGADFNQVKSASQKSCLADRRAKFIALFVGQVGIRKGVPYLLEAWKKLSLRNADLYLLGEIEPVAERVLAPYRQIPSIHFVGYADPQSYYQQADVFVFPSIEEGSALVTYEALAAGLPLITTFNSGSVIEDGKEGFIVPVDQAEALAEKIEFLYNHPSELAVMREQARRTGERYSWESYGDRLAEAYRRLA